MSNVVPFDTLALAQALRDEAGYDPRQAEGTAKVFARLLVADLVTKDDLKATVEAAKAELKADIRETELRLEAKVEAVKADLLKSILGFLMAAVTVNTAVVVGAMFGLAKLLGH